MRGLMIAGTDTGVGKTRVACLAAAALCARGVPTGVYKPVCSGAEWDHGQPRWSDIEALFEATGGIWPRERIGPQRFLAPLAPPLSAAREGRSVDWSLLAAGWDWWRAAVDAVIVEGAGGVFCPVTPDRTMLDVAGHCDCPVLIVGRAGLGTINHTLLTIEALRSRQITIAGVVLSEVEPVEDRQAIAENAEEIRRRGAERVLGLLPHGSSEFVDAKTFQPTEIDWLALLGAVKEEGTPPEV